MTGAAHGAAIGAKPPARAKHPPLEVVRQCAEKWQAMKRGGAADGLLWRDFSVRCYQDADGHRATHKTLGQK